MTTAIIFNPPAGFTAMDAWREVIKNCDNHEIITRGKAAKIWQKVKEWNRRKIKKRHGGALGAPAMLILETMIFKFFNFNTGRCDPGHKAIHAETGFCKQTIAKTLNKLRGLGIIDWICRKIRVDDGRGGVVWKQLTNVYILQPISKWIGFFDKDVPPEVLPHEWGAQPPLPAVAEQATTAKKEGCGDMAIRQLLRSDERDGLSCAVARLFEAISAKKPTFLPESD